MQPRHINAIVSALGLLSLVACGSGVEIITGEQLDHRSGPIVNGQEDSGHPAVGLLRSGNGNYYNSMCTATLVGKKTVLSAAHCVQNKSAAVFKVGGKSYQAAKIIQHPSYSWSKLNAYDVAVIILSQPVSGVKPYAISKKPPVVGDALTIVGFGITKSGWGNSGTKRVTQNTVSKVRTQYFSFSGSSAGKGNICQGDSGGPAFRMEGSREVLIGVHSTASQPCGYTGNDMRADVFRDWIAVQAGGDLAGDDVNPPTVNITEPIGGAQLKANFTVKVTAADKGSGLAAIKVYVDGQLKGTAQGSPATISLSGVAVGQHNLRADATDRAGNTGSVMVSVTVKPKAAPPPKNDPPKNNPPSTPPSPGSFGGSCTTAADCSEGFCIFDSYVQQRYCTKVCGPTSLCPTGSDCIEVDSTRICAVSSFSENGASPSDGEVLMGGCSAANTARAPAGLLLLLFLLALLRRRDTSR